MAAAAQLCPKVKPEYPKVQMRPSCAGDVIQGSAVNHDGGGLSCLFLYSSSSLVSAVQMRSLFLWWTVPLKPWVNREGGKEAGRNGGRRWRNDITGTVAWEVCNSRAIMKA